MTARSQQCISIKQAAALIYRARDPSPAQVRCVAELVARGEIDGSGHATTMEAVADYLARAALDRRAASRAPRASSEYVCAAHHESLGRVYRETLKDYFLALIFRRKTFGARKSFQRAVLGGQVAILLMLAAAVFLTARTTLAPLDPERAAVVRWLRENHQHFRILQWHRAVPGEFGQVRMRVEYHYVTDRRKGIDTDRVFTITGGQVVSVDAEVE